MTLSVKCRQIVLKMGLSGIRKFANMTFANNWRKSGGILANAHLTFANWRMSRGYTGESRVDIRQYWRKSSGHSPVLAVLDTNNSLRIRSNMISSWGNKYNESVKVESEGTNDVHFRSRNAEGQGNKTFNRSWMWLDNVWNRNWLILFSFQSIFSCYSIREWWLQLRR